MEETYDRVAAAVSDADSTAVLTGAGVSTASGVPSFRGDDGVWDEFDPMAFHRRRLDADPSGFWADRIELRDTMFPDGRPAPNAAHEALAALEAAGHVDAVLTQNVDRLHQDAGSETVVELHGTNQEVTCDDCGDRVAAEPVFDRARAGELPPRCDCCGVYRPAVVLFGEELRDRSLQTANEYARESDCFLAVGSSLSVRPAAGLPSTAASSGATLVVINLEETPRDGEADVVLRDDVTDALPAIRDRIVEK